MSRRVCIAIALLLAAVHAAVVPLHVAVVHGHGARMAAAHGVLLHMHGPDHDHDHDAAGHCGDRALHWCDASDYGHPHQHAVTGHTMSDHFFVPKGASKWQPAIAASARIEPPAAAVADSQPAPAGAPPPPRAVFLDLPALRGPPLV